MGTAMTTQWVEILDPQLLEAWTPREQPRTHTDARDTAGIARRLDPPSGPLRDPHFAACVERIAAAWDHFIPRR